MQYTHGVLVQEAYLKLVEFPLTTVMVLVGIPSAMSFTAKEKSWGNRMILSTVTSCMSQKQWTTRRQINIINVWRIFFLIALRTKTLLQIWCVLPLKRFPLNDIEVSRLLNNETIFLGLNMVNQFIFWSFTGSLIKADWLFV